MLQIQVTGVVSKSVNEKTRFTALFQRHILYIGSVDHVLVEGSSFLS